MIATEVKHLTEADQLKQAFCKAIVAVAKQIPQKPTLAILEQVAPYVPHISEVAANLHTWLIDEDLIIPFNGIASFHEGRAAYTEAIYWSEICRERAEIRLGKNHPNTATSLNNLALLYAFMGRYGEAEPLYLRSVEIYETQLGKNDPSIVPSLNNLAALYKSMECYGEAESLFLRSLRILKTQLNCDLTDIALCLNNLALLYQSMERYDKVESLYLESLHIFEPQLGEDHSDIAGVLNNLATFYKLMGRYDEAGTLYVRSLHIIETQLGANHIDAARSLNNLAELCELMGWYSYAEPLYLKSLEILAKLPVKDHPYAEITCRNFRYLLQQALVNGRTAELSNHPITQQLLQELRNN